MTVTTRSRSRGVVGRVDVRALGGFEVIAGDRQLARTDWQRITAERLFKLLLVTPGHRLSRDAAAEILWPDAEQATSSARLRKAIHFVGVALGPGMLVSDSGILRLDGECLDLDLDRLEAALDLLAVASVQATDGRSGAIPAGRHDNVVAAALDTVLELGARELLPDDAYEDWLVAPRERLRSRWQHVALAAAERARECGRKGDAHDLVTSLLERDPTDEAAHRLAIELYASEGRHHAARRQFDLCRRALRSGLDAEPSEETVAAFRSAEREATRLGPDRQETFRLVGRQVELERAEPLFDQVANDRLGVLIVHGPTGIGKTRFLDEIVAYARAAGWRVMSWQAVEAEQSLAYAPIRVALPLILDNGEATTWDEPARSGIATLLPGLLGQPALTFKERPALVAALVGVLERLARPAPLVIAIDDLPWLDDASTELLTAAISGLTARRILLATTFRDDEPLVDRASSLLDQIRRAGAIELALGPLAHRDVEPLIVSHLGGSSLQPELAQRVYERGGGNPLFCLEIARAALDDGSVRIVDGRWRLGSDRLPDQLPVSVRQLVARRTAALPVDVRELLKVTAEMGSDAAYETLEAVAMGGERSMLQALDLALGSGLLVERGPRYAFAHPLYRLAVRTATGSRQRGRIHLAVALALAGGAAVDAQPSELEAAAAACPDASAVADHALAAVELGLTAALPMAVAFGFEAGARARRLLDFDHARTVLDRAFAAHRRMPAPLRERFATGRSLLNLGGLQVVANDEAAAARSYRAAIAAARTPDEAAEAYSAAQWLPYRHGDFDAALAILEEGLAAIPPDAAVARAQLELDIGWCLVRLGRLPEARRLLEGAATVLERSRALSHAMKALDYLGDTLGMLGDTQGAVGRLERSLAIAREMQDSHGELVARLHLGLTLTAAGRYVLARPHVERALDLAHMVGDRYIEAVAALSGAVMEDHEGDIPAARAYRRRELALLVAIGGNALHEAASHAHLASLARRSGDAASAEREAAEARRLARQCEMPGYEEAIERSLIADPWPLQPR